MITQDDIIRIEIDDTMRKNAYADADFLKSKLSYKTINIKQDRDVIGSLGHQAVEQAFFETDFYYHSTREERYFQGDAYDIKYEEDTIDIKATCGRLDQYFYNKQFLILKKQFDNQKMEKISHLCFVLVDPDYTQAWIFGLITRSDFLSLSTSVKLTLDNLALRARYLKSFSSYVFRVKTEDPYTPRGYKRY